MKRLNKKEYQALIALLNGEKVGGTQFKKNLSPLLSDRCLSMKQLGIGRLQVEATDKERLLAVLKANYSINSVKAMESAIKLMEGKGTRRENQLVFGEGGHNIKVMNGGLVTSTKKMAVKVGKEDICLPLAGGCYCLYSWEDLRIPENAVIVYVENTEVFRNIEHYEYLWKNDKNPKLYVNRFFAKDKTFKNWLAKIPNSYLHFGDFDLGGIAVYQQFYNLLGERAEMIIPENIEVLISKWGSRSLYNKQRKTQLNQKINDPKVIKLYSIIKKYKKGFEQEALYDEFCL